MANKKRSPRYKEQGVKSVGGYAGRLSNPPLNQPTTPFWNPGDLPSGNDIANWLNNQTSQWNYYGGYQGPPTPTPGAGDMYANPGAYPWNYSPPPATPTNIGTGGVPTYTPMPGVPSFSPVPSGPPQAPEYAPTNTAMPSGGSAGGYQGYSDQDWYRNYGWRSEYNEPAYIWNEDGTLSVNPNASGGAASPVPGWTSSYSRDFYANQPLNNPTWIGGREGGASSMGRGRLPSRYYIPKQEFYKTKGGKTYASREGYEDALGIPEDDNKKGNNNMIPLWAGPLVNWRK